MRRRLNPDLISAEEAAELIGVSRNSLFAAAKRGEVPHRRIGRRVLWSRKALQAWLAHEDAPVGYGGGPELAPPPSEK